MFEQVIPAKVGDIIKKVESHYEADPEVEDGEHFVVLDVFSGDDTAVVLGRDGELKTLCYPEEYRVIGTTKELVDMFNQEISDTSEKYRKLINGNNT